MKQLIYCSLLSLVLLFIFPFDSKLTWLPAKKFEVAYQELEKQHGAKLNFKIKIEINSKTLLFAEANKLTNSKRVLELLNESGVFSSPQILDSPYLRITLLLEQGIFSGHLSDQDFKSNMPIQVLLSLLISQGLLGNDLASV